MKYLFIAFAVLLMGGASMASDKDFQLRKDIDMGWPDKLASDLKSMGISPDLMTDDDTYGVQGIALIAYAARAGSVNCVAKLLELGARPDGGTVINESALMLAALFNDFDNAGHPTDTYFHHEAIVHQLVAAGARLENPQFYTPLAYATYYDHLRVVDYLLAHGAKPDGDFTEKEKAMVATPLLFAVSLDYRDAMMHLLIAGADARIQDKHGLNALEVAIKKHHADLIPALQCAVNLQPGQAFKDVCHVTSSDPRSSERQNNSK